MAEMDFLAATAVLAESIEGEATSATGEALDVELEATLAAGEGLDAADDELAADTDELEVDATATAARLADVVAVLFLTGTVSTYINRIEVSESS